MNQDNKLLSSLLKRIQELDEENKEIVSNLHNMQVENKKLKEKLSNQSNNKANSVSSFNSEPYLKVKELSIVNQNEEQVCTLCNCELNQSNSINVLKIYFCNNNNCSLLMEKIIENAIDIFRKK